MGSLGILLEANHHKALIRRKVGKFKEHEEAEWDYSRIMRSIGRDKV